MSYLPKLPGGIQNDFVAVYQIEHRTESNENKQSENKKGQRNSKTSKRKWTRQSGNNLENLATSKIPIFKTSKGIKKRKQQAENNTFDSSYSSNSDSDTNLDTNDLSFTSKVVNNVLNIKGEFI